jgi:hypothetical protein
MDDIVEILFDLFQISNFYKRFGIKGVLFLVLGIILLLVIIVAIYNIR